MIYDTEIESVLSLVAPPDENGCEVWTGELNEKGYGRRRFRDGKNRRIHRVVWELRNGPIPDGLLVCHRCDNPPCCNPEHLFLGTHADNVLDMMAKGRRKDATSVFVGPRMKKYWMENRVAIIAMNRWIEGLPESERNSYLWPPREIAEKFGILVHVVTKFRSVKFPRDEW